MSLLPSNNIIIILLYFISAINAGARFDEARASVYLFESIHHTINHEFEPLMKK